MHGRICMPRSPDETDSGPFLKFPRLGDLRAWTNLTIIGVWSAGYYRTLESVSRKLDSRLRDWPGN